MAAGANFRVDIEALASSAAHVAGQGDDLASAHLSSDSRIAAAQSGWVGSSGAGLRIGTAAWLETSPRLLIGGTPVRCARYLRPRTLAGRPPWRRRVN